MAFEGSRSAIEGLGRGQGRLPVGGELLGKDKSGVVPVRALFSPGQWAIT